MFVLCRKTPFDSDLRPTISKAICLGGVGGNKNLSKNRIENGITFKDNLLLVE